jgi:hypothetical protein
MIFTTRVNWSRRPVFREIAAGDGTSASLLCKTGFEEFRARLTPSNAAHVAVLATLSAHHAANFGIADGAVLRDADFVITGSTPRGTWEPATRGSAAGHRPPR